MGSSTTEMVKLRGALRLEREKMHATPPGTLPLPSADFSARDHSVQVGGDPGAPSLYEESFSGFGWLHDADVRGFLALQLTSRPAEPGFLKLETQSGRAIRGSLVYRFESYFPLDQVEVTLDAAAPAEAHCRNTLSLSTDELGREWPLQVVQPATETIQPLVLRDNEMLKGLHVFFLRVSMENHAERPDLPGNRIDRLQVRCSHQPPQPGAAAMLVTDEYGNLTYQDDFRSRRWSHLGRLDVGHQGYGGFRDSGFWVGLKGGHATSTHLVQRITSPQRLQQLAVTADCYADGQNLGGTVTLGIGARGEDPKWTTQTQGRHKGLLRLEIPKTDFPKLQEFDVHITLHSSSGVEHGDKVCATLRALSISGQSFISD